MRECIDTVIFDFDGVLFDTEEINYSANELAFNEFGLKFSRDEYLRLWIEEGLDMEDIIGIHGLRTTAEHLRSTKNIYFAEQIEKTPLTLIKGIHENLEYLISQRYKIAIASSNLRRNIELVLDKAGVNFNFTSIVGREDILSPKPSPEVFIKCLKNCNSAPENAVVIEDAPKGILAAKRAKIKDIIAIPNIWTKHGNFSEASMVIESAEFIHVAIRFFESERQQL